MIVNGSVQKKCIKRRKSHVYNKNKLASGYVFHWGYNAKHIVAVLILGLHPANERRRYKVTPSLIGWTQT